MSQPLPPEPAPAASALGYLPIDKISPQQLRAARWSKIYGLGLILYAAWSVEHSIYIFATLSTRVHLAAYISYMLTWGLLYYGVPLAAGTIHWLCGRRIARGSFPALMVTMGTLPFGFLILALNALMVAPWLYQIMVRLLNYEKPISMSVLLINGPQLLTNLGAACAAVVFTLRIIQVLVHQNRPLRARCIPNH